MTRRDLECYRSTAGAVPGDAWDTKQMEIPKDAKPKHVQISYEAMKLVAPGIDGKFWSHPQTL